jgi:hypothetical protein
MRRNLAVGLAASALLFAFAPRARAAGLNDYACRPSAAKPYPVVLAHGRSGHATDLVAITNALDAAGFCVFGEDYGQVTPTGQTGMDHLAVSAGEYEIVVDKVLAATGASKVDAVGYSEGMGVVGNFILARGGASRVHRVVSFGGLEHPYAHVGLAGVVDGVLFLPNTIKAVQASAPPFTSNVSAHDIVAAALGLAGTVGAKLSPADEEVVESAFVSDLFDPAYWTKLHGALSEAPGAFVAVNPNGHAIKTHDAAPSVCYTNIVSTADAITGQSAGYQDEAPNVENFLLVSNADHGGIISDPVAVGKMVAAFESPCAASESDAGASSGGRGATPDSGVLPDAGSGGATGDPPASGGGGGGGTNDNGGAATSGDASAATPSGCACRSARGGASGTAPTLAIDRDGAAKALG